MTTTATAIEKSAQKGQSATQQTPPAAKEQRKPQRHRDNDRFKIFCGSANEPLAEDICKFLDMPRGQAHLQRFSDGEVYFQLLENVRGADVFVVQPTCYPVDQHLMELLLMIDALKRASARRITPVIPYY
jgi:ribose-phosphate pyrophosphokinase